MLGLTDEEIDDIFKGIYSGKINPENLPENLYASIAEKLKEGVYKGYGGSLKSIESSLGYGSAPSELLKNLRENIYLFAGAKTFHQMEDMRGLLTENGKVLTYSEFKKKAQETYKLYNETWMESEYNTAIGQAESARMWADIEQDKELFPFLRYIAVMDLNTSTICRPLNDIILPVDDKFWSTFMPLNHYNCRCVVEKLEKGDAVITHKDKVSAAGNEVKSKMNDAFKMNPGKTGEVFGKEHPYFKDVPDEYKDLASDNFNLPIPEIKKVNRKK
ncbi:MAG: phage minor head protein [Bacteroidota bacterium]